MNRVIRRLLAVALVGLAAAGAAGCLQPSLQPLFEAQDTKFDARLLGTWACGTAETWTFAQAQDTDGGRTILYYDVAVKSGTASGSLEATLGRLEPHDYVLFDAVKGAAGRPLFVARQYVNVYTFGRITIGDDRMRIAMLDGSYFSKHKDDAAVQPLGVADGGSFLLTAAPKSLQAFLLAHGDDRDLFQEDAVVLVRPGQTGGKCYTEGK